MRKLRDDSTWNRLTPEQREILETWLFDQNLGYEKILERVKKEFGLESTIASLGRYYRRRARERQVEELVEAQAAASELNHLPVNAEDLRAAVMKLVGKAVLKLAIEKPDDLQQLVSLSKLLLDSEDNDIRRARLKLAERCLNQETLVAARKEAPNVKAYLIAIGDDASLSHEEKLERVQELLFGRDLPKENINGQEKFNNGT